MIYTPQKLESENSFEILSINRTMLHNRRTLSGVISQPTKVAHRKSYSSQFTGLSADFQTELKRIKEELESRKAEQERRESIIETILGIDYSGQTEEEIEENNKSEDRVKGFFTLCIKWMSKCWN